MGFILDGLDADDFDRNYKDVHLVKRIISYFKPYKTQLFIIIISLLIGSLASTLVPVYISLMIDDLQNSLVSSKSSQNQTNYTFTIFKKFSIVIPFASAVVTLAVALSLFFIINFISNMFQYEFTARATSSAIVDIREDAFKAVLSRDMSFITEESTGNIVSRVDNDTKNFSQSITLATSLVAQIAVEVFLLIFLYSKSVQLTILLILMAPVVIITALLFRRIAREVNRKSTRIIAKINAMIQETFSGIYITKAFRAEEKTFIDLLEVYTS